MSRVYAGAMITLMALCVFGAVLPLGAVNAEVAAPAYALVGLLGVLWAAGLFFAQNPRWNASPMHWPVAAFLAYAAIRYFSSPVEYDARGELFQVGVCGLVYFVCATQFERPSDRSFFLVALMILAVFESGYGIWQALSKSSAVLQWLRPEGYQGRASGTFIYPNHLAAFLELVLGLVVARAALVRRESEHLERSVILKVLTLYVALMVVAGIVLTRSRAGWAAMATGLSLFVFLGDWRPRFSWARAGLVVILIASMALTLWKVDFTRHHLLRTLNLDSETPGVSLADPTLGGRTLMWKGTLEMIREHPVFGTGAGTWQWIFQQHRDPSLLTRPQYAHNDLLNLASDYGLVGFLLMASVFVGFWRQARALSGPGQPPEKQAFAIGVLVSVCSVVVHSWFDFNFHIPANAVLLAAILGFTAAMEDGRHGFGRRSLSGFQRYGLGTAALVFCGVGMWFFVPTALATRYTDLGNLLKRQIEYDAALSYYERAIALDPNSPEPRARKGDVYRAWATFRLGPQQQSERRALALQAIEAYDRALRLNPYQSFVLLDKARALEMAGESAQAEKTYQRAIEVYPSNGFAYFLQGCFFRDHGEPARAREAFKRSQQLYYSPSSDLNSLELESPR